MVACLLRFGADPNAAEGTSTALAKACEGGFDRTVAALLQAGATVSPLKASRLSELQQLPQGVQEKVLHALYTNEDELFVQHRVGYFVRCAAMPRPLLGGCFLGRSVVYQVQYLTDISHTHRHVDVGRLVWRIGSTPVCPAPFQEVKVLRDATPEEEAAGDTSALLAQVQAVVSKLRVPITLVSCSMSSDGLEATFVYLRKRFLGEKPLCLRRLVKQLRKDVFDNHTDASIVFVDQRKWSNLDPNATIDGLAVAPTASSCAIAVERVDVPSDAGVAEHGE
eukprot:TRINITY_DN44126_c0_g1_i1.p1 TRINITY_DN44126_c0_g1~~TRINITY_DN44126_c0_g1_i1.p1  ORF type:complete len:313 (+),score=87.04 TRINITY_DN44126_c0_g1_i1:100-939(+)